MTDAEWEKREHDMAAAWARCADEADSLKDAWEALFATLDERGLPFDTVAFRVACDTARDLIANAQGEHSPGATADGDMLDPVVVPDFATGNAPEKKLKKVVSRG